MSVSAFALKSITQRNMLCQYVCFTLNTKFWTKFKSPFCHSASSRLHIYNMSYSQHCHFALRSKREHGITRVVVSGMAEISEEAVFEVPFCFALAFAEVFL